MNTKNSARRLPRPWLLVGLVLTLTSRPALANDPDAGGPGEPVSSAPMHGGASALLTDDPNAGGPGFVDPVVDPVVAPIPGGASALLADDPDAGGPGPGSGNPVGVPIDGGASVLLAVGVGVGLRQLRRRYAADH